MTRYIPEQDIPNGLWFSPRSFLRTGAKVMKSWTTKALVMFVSLCFSQVCNGIDFITSATTAKSITYTVTVDGTDGRPANIASIHIQGPKMGTLTGFTTEQPTGWTFNGNEGDGNYSWEINQNVSGTLVFKMSYDDIPGLSATHSSVQFDVLVGDQRQWTTVTPPTTPTKDNWAVVPVPEPSTYVLALAGASVIALVQRSRRLRIRQTH